MVLDDFWNNIWNGIQQFFNNLGNFFLQENEYGLNVLSRIIIAIAVMVIGVIIIKLVIALLKRASGIKRGLTLDMSAKSFFIGTLKIVLYVILAFLVVAILGLDVSGAVGIASAVTVALGLALQDIIGMFASGLLLFQVKNFKTGDYIKVSNSFGSEEGKVFRISLLYTTLLNVNGQKIHIPNNNVTKANVTNYADHENRRGVISLYISGEEDSEKVFSVLMEVAKNDERVLKDPAPSAVIGDFREFGVQYDLRFFSKLETYWDTLFDLRAACLKALKDSGVKFARINRIEVKENANNE